MGVVHYITFSNGNNRFTGIPYSKGQDVLVNSIQNNTNRKIVYHTHTLNTIRSRKWFNRLEKLKQYVDVDRDGYFNAWKPMIVKEIYDIMDDTDIIYYTDSSTYYMQPFEYSLDNFFDYTEKVGNICGSMGIDFKNGEGGYCDEKKVWKYMWSGADYDNLMLKPHILNSWFAFAKNDINSIFINEWDNYIDSILDDMPLCTYHHTVDQSIFNILVYKHNMNVFFNHKKHNDNKDHNVIHKTLASEQLINIEDLKKWFYNPNNFKYIKKQ
jgi:hypothetical protein